MKHAIACLNTQLGILLHNASVFHGEGREEDRDRNIAEADDLRMAVEALKDEIPFEGFRPHDSWEETAKQYAGNADFYRSIVTRIGELYGDAAKRCDDGTMSQDVLALVVPELVETSIHQFRLLASFVGSKATSHTEIVSDTAAEIRGLRTSLEAERQRTLEAERKLADATKEIRDLRVTKLEKLEHDVQVQLLVAAREKAEARAEYFKLAYEGQKTKCRELEFRDYRFLNVGEKLESKDQYSPGDGTWLPIEDYDGCTVGRDEKWKYRRPWKGYPGYRMLGADEKLCDGDEFHSSSGRWVPTMESGNRVGRKYVGQYRRPVVSEPQEQQYRMMEVGEITQEGDEAHTDSGVWSRLTGYHLGQRINERGSYPVGYYRRPIPLDTEPEKPETPAA